MEGSGVEGVAGGGAAATGEVRGSFAATEGAAAAGITGGSSAVAEGAAATGITGGSSAVAGIRWDGRTVVYRGRRETDLLVSEGAVGEGVGGLGAKGKMF